MNSSGWWTFHTTYYGRKRGRVSSMRSRGKEYVVGYSKGWSKNLSSLNFWRLKVCFVLNVYCLTSLCLQKAKYKRLKVRLKGSRVKRITSWFISVPAQIEVHALLEPLNTLATLYLGWLVVELLRGLICSPSHLRVLVCNQRWLKQTDMWTEELLCGERLVVLWNQLVVSASNNNLRFRL